MERGENEALATTPNTLADFFVGVESIRRYPARFILFPNANHTPPTRRQKHAQRQRKSTTTTPEHPLEKSGEIQGNCSAYSSLLCEHLSPLASGSLEPTLRSFAPSPFLSQTGSREQNREQARTKTKRREGVHGGRWVQEGGEW